MEVNKELTKENYNKINGNGLYDYLHKPKGYSRDAYWCKNWSFTPNKRADGTIVMQDTYWGNENCIWLNDDNFQSFKLIFDFTEVEQVHDNNVNEYDEKDLYRVATGSGGYSCGRLHWKNKKTKPSQRLQRIKKVEAIRDAERQLSWAKSDLELFEEKCKKQSCT